MRAPAGVPTLLSNVNLGGGAGGDPLFLGFHRFQLKISFRPQAKVAWPPTHPCHSREVQGRGGWGGEQ